MSKQKLAYRQIGEYFHSHYVRQIIADSGQTNILWFFKWSNENIYSLRRLYTKLLIVFVPCASVSVYFNIEHAFVLYQK